MSQAVQINLEPSLIEANTEFRPWKYIVIHHTATLSGSVESIHEKHLQRRDASGRHWRGIGYHYLIGNGNGMEDGEIQATFRWRDQLSGAHAGQQQFNEYGIGICLVGNFEQTGPTSAQQRAVRQLVSELKSRFGMTEEQILKHGDLKATACPGRLFPFEKIASVHPAGLQVTDGKERSRFTSVNSADMEGIKNVAAIQRANSAKRAVSGRESDGQFTE